MEDALLQQQDPGEGAPAGIRAEKAGGGSPGSPAPGPRRPRPNKFLGRSLLGPLGALGALGTDSALHDARVAATPSRTSAPTEVVWPTSSARSRPGSPRPVGSRGLPCNPHARPCNPHEARVSRRPPRPRAPRLQPPEPPRSATPASGRAPPPGPTPRTRAAGRHSPALTVSLLRGHGRYRRSQLRPGARSAGPVRELGDPEPGGRGGHPHAGHAPRDRERTPERQEGPGGAPGGCPGYGACAEPSPSRALRVVGGDSGRLAGKTGEAL